MNYKQTIDYLFDVLPMYQRLGVAAYRADLKNAFTLDAYFGYPHKKFKSVHVAGTNGKGSVSHIMASVFQSAGYKTGLYTSPHLVDFRERIKIDGTPVDKEFVTEFTQKNLAFFKKVQASFFEMTVFMAFEYFAKNEVDVAIIEVGLGGRLDTTNIITPELSIITNIGLDHTRFLGNDLESIAVEKAGIIKTKVAIVIGKTQLETQPVFNRIAGMNESSILFADQLIKCDYHLRNLDDSVQYHFTNSINNGITEINTDLKGTFQKENIITALTALSILNDREFSVSDIAIRKGLRNVSSNTGLLGRWQEIDHNPLVVCDIAHNTEGIKQILEQIEDQPYKQLHMVLGFVSDKKINDILNLLPEKAIYYLCEPKIPRAMKVADLSRGFQHKGLKFMEYNNVTDAYISAKEKALKNDLIYIGGSTFVVADFLV